MNPEVEYWQRLPSEMMYHFSRCFFPDSRKKPPGSTLFANVGKTDRKGLGGQGTPFILLFMSHLVF
jgi:hypothetical protein